ncbi:MAG: 50S ribosomal protein L3 [Nanoarchaeota archaeon]|nr:50S ribosomal protein L3 [Nanoarchaeota archaeon]MBU1644492.1 50S ribosomal protein L3 [Nanoarchaeota archaeon]MBU1976496.1 50S ribosomal protein L3 [Nanoarchaeota archaeon]
MPRSRHPRRGSLQYWPRKRAKQSVARVRSWAEEKSVKPLGFIGYKAGMTHLVVQDSRPKSLTKGEKIVLASTIIDCPPMSVMGICFYKKYLFGTKKVASVLAEKLSKDLAKVVQLPKKVAKKVDDVKEFDDLRLLIYSSPKTSTGVKKPKLLEIALGGKKEDKLVYAKDVLGKEIKIDNVFENGVSVDIKGISKGKGFQGTVKRYGVPIRQHKAEKTKRGIATLGSWTPKRVEFSVAQPGKMGYHLRTEYNKQILKIGQDGKEVTPKQGKNRYGLVNNSYLLIKGSVVGPKKRAILLTKSLRPNKKMVKEGFQISYISLRK